MEKAFLPHRLYDRLHRLQQQPLLQLRRGFFFAGACLAQRKPSSAVLVAAHMVGRSHHCHAELAHRFSMVFRHLNTIGSH